MSAIVAPLRLAGLIIGAPDRQDWLATSIGQKLSVQEQHQLLPALKLLRRSLTIELPASCVLLTSTL